MVMVFVTFIIVLFSVWVWHLKHELDELQRRVLAVPKGTVKEIPMKKPLKQWEKDVPTWNIG
jgi:hypothetical protein